MIIPPKPANETERLAALHAYNILDTTPERSYDDIVHLVAYVCQVPMATISLVDDARQWFKSRIGLEAQETGRDISFCANTILADEPMVVDDATRDYRFADSPLVQGAPHIRFYAGFPLITPEGYALGSLCAIDRTPRQLSPEQSEAMKALTRQLMTLLELRRVSAKMAAALQEVKTLQSLLPVCAWCKRVRDSDGSWMSPELYIMNKSRGSVTHGICPTCLAQQQPV
ncbi:MAG: GAF domain-containing protein [Verrucomicrobiota bacterium]